MNLYGKMFGTTTLTIWDQTNRPVSFLVRVSLDTKDLESRIRQAFPGAEIKVRQVGPQIILDGQAPDSKTHVGHPPARHDDAHEQPVVSVAERRRGAAEWAAAWRRWGGGWAARRRHGGGGMGGGMGMGGGGGMGGRRRNGRRWRGGGIGDGDHQSRDRSRPAADPAPRQDRGDQPKRDPQHRGELGLCPGEIDHRLGGRQQCDDDLRGEFGTISQATGPTGFVEPCQATVGGTNIGHARPGTSPLFGVFDAGHFSLFIDALRTNNLAKILAEPNLVALDGQPARFLVGGLFPFPVPQSSSIPGGTAVVTVQFQRFGTILTFLPEILPNDVIRLDVEPVISQLNFAQGTTVGTGHVPSITEQSARTVVELREGQTLAIAGLLQSLTNATTIRIPGLGDLPIVGPWFSANSDRDDRDRDDRAGDSRAGLAPRQEGRDRSAGRPRLPAERRRVLLLGRIEGKLGREFRATKAEQDPLNLMKHFQSEQQWVVGPHGHAD